MYRFSEIVTKVNGNVYTCTSQINLLTGQVCGLVNFFILIAVLKKKKKNTDQSRKHFIALYAERDPKNVGASLRDVARPWGRIRITKFSCLGCKFSAVVLNIKCKTKKKLLFTRPFLNENLPVSVVNHSHTTEDTWSVATGRIWGEGSPTPTSIQNSFSCCIIFKETFLFYVVTSIFFSISFQI